MATFPFSRLFSAGINQVNVNDYFLTCVTLAGSVTLILPSSQKFMAERGKMGFQPSPFGFAFADFSRKAKVNNIIIQAATGDLINGAASVTINKNGASGLISIASDGTWSLNSADVSNVTSIAGEVTVSGSGDADYETLADALDAKKTNIAIIGNTIETRNSITTQNAFITLNGNIGLGLGDFNINIVTDNVTLTFENYGRTDWSPTTSKPLFNAVPTPFTGNITNGSPIVTNVSVNTNTLRVGQTVNGADIPNGTTIKSIDSSSQITLTNNATNTVVAEVLNGSLLNSAVVLLPNGININGVGGTANDCPVYKGFISATVGALSAITLPNQHGWGFHTGGAFIEFKTGTIVFVSITSGTNVYDLYDASGVLDELVLLGNYSSTQNIINTATGSEIGRLTITDFAPAILKVAIGGSLLSFNSRSGLSGLDIAITSNGTNIQNCNILTGNVDTASKSGVFLFNVFCNDVIDVPDSAYYNTVLRAGHAPPDLKSIIKNITVIP